MHWHRTLLFIALMGLILTNLGAVSAATTNISTTKDTYNYEYHLNSNYDGYTYLGTGCAAGLLERSRYAYIEFDLSGLPADVVITSAELYIYETSAVVEITNLALYRVTESWDAGTLKWTNRPASVVSGTDKLVTISGAAGWHNVDVTDMARGWQNGTYNNYGLQLWNVTDTSPISPYFNSSEAVRRSPTLLVTYIIPASDPVNLQHTSGNFWVNYTWDKGTNGKIINSWNVSQNGTWVNGTTNNWNNSNVGHHGTSTIKVYGYNLTGDGNISTGYVSDTVTVPNNLPTVTVVTPTSNYLNVSWNVALNVTGTDLEGDSLTYHYFGGESLDSMAYLGANESIHNNSYNWTVSKSKKYYWYAFANDTYGNGSACDTHSFSMDIAPQLLSPTTASITYVTYPPLTADVTFKWEDLSSPQYRILIAEDSNFNIVAVDNYVTTNYSTESLETNEKYYWKMYFYDGTHTGSASGAFYFDLLANITETSTAIHGVIFTEDSTTLNDALVVIWNATWSDSMLTGSNGYYLFEDLDNSSTYSVQSSKDLYEDSVVYYINPVYSNWSLQNIYLVEDLGSYEWRHYVKFTVRTLFGTRYDNCTINIYEDGETALYKTKLTGTDGSASFILYKNERYQIDAISAADGIDQTMYVTPKDNDYWILVSTLIAPWQDTNETISEEIEVEITTADKTTVHSWINITYDDAMSETTALRIYINETDLSDPTNQTVVSVWTSDLTNFSHSFTVYNSAGKSYFVHIEAVHTTFGNLNKSYTVIFKDDKLADYPGIPPMAFTYFAIFLMIFTAAIGTARTSEMIFILTCVEGWIFYLFNLFSPLGQTVEDGICVGLTFATFLAIVAYISKRKNEEGY